VSATQTATAATLASIVIFTLFGFLASRNGCGPVLRWSLAAPFVFLVAGRIGFVLTHSDLYASNPLAAFAIWNGGFNPIFGLAGFAIITSMMLRPHGLIGAAAAPAFAAAGAWFVTALVLTVAMPPDTSNIRLNVVNLDDGHVSPSILEGKPVVLNFWATWCPPCVREMPLLAQMAQERDDVTFVFVNQSESEETIKSFLARYELSLENIVLDREGAVFRNYAGGGLPTTVFLASDGERRSVHIGEIDRTTLLATLEDLTARETDESGAP
jgi:thiol-disulfide isomerase/thioredoxin